MRAYRDASGGRGEPAAVLGQGDNLGADDLYTLGLGPSGPLNPFACGPDADWRRCWGNQRGDDLGQMVKASVWALNPEDSHGRGHAIHFRVDKHGLSEDARNAWAGYGLLRTQHCIGHESCEHVCTGVSWDVYVANVRPVEETHHPWRGMAPFPDFEPGQYLEDCAVASSLSPAAARPALRDTEFNQPSVFIQLHEDPQAVAAAQGPSLLAGSGQVSWPGATLDLQDDRASLPRMTSGMHVLARAQTYYHRPGNWQEMPNFFNPYWRPRLAAIYQGRYAAGTVDDWLRTLPEPLARIPQKVLTH